MRKRKREWEKWRRLGRGIPAQRQSQDRETSSKERFASEVITPVQIGKEISAGFTFFEEGEIDLARVQLLVEPVEIEQMIFGTAASIIGRAVGFDQERPVAGLGEEKLACRLFERALNRGVARLAAVAGDFRHPPSGAMKVGIDPGVLFIQPDTTEAVLAPARGIWLHDLLSRMATQKIARGSEFKLTRFGGGAPDEALEKMRTFEPPVPEKLGIKWTHDHGRDFAFR